MATSIYKEYFKGYEILGELGRGNARVLKAKKTATGELVAIKHFSFNAEEDTLKRFQRESEIMKSIRHDHVVKILDVHLNAELPYIVMELVEDGDLRKLLKEKESLDTATVLRLAWHMTDALEAIHANHVVHRDIKPENIMFKRLPNGELHFLLTDFGIAKLREQAEKLTVTGASMLTYEYASPEQFNQSGNVGCATDYYSLGVVLYECLTGTVPFEFSQNDLLQHIHRVVGSHVPVPVMPEGKTPVPSLRRLLDLLLAKQSDLRLSDPRKIRGLLRDAAAETVKGTGTTMQAGFVEIKQKQETLSYPLTNARKKKISFYKPVLALLSLFILFWALSKTKQWNNISKGTLAEKAKKLGSLFDSSSNGSEKQNQLDGNPSLSKDGSAFLHGDADNALFAVNKDEAALNQDGTEESVDPGIPLTNGIYYNDFSDREDSIWKTEESDNEFRVEEGKYVIHGTADSFTYHSSVKIDLDIEKDFNISASATLWENGSNRGFGLNYCSDTDRDLYYVYYISGNGYYSIRSWVNNEWQILVDWTKSANIRPYMEMNTLTIEKHGGFLHFQINEKTEKILPFNGGFGSSFGFRVDGAQTVAFDQFLVKGKE